MSRIVILIHRHGSFDHPPYFLKEIARIWHEQGHQIILQLGPGPKIDADVVIVHVDLTVIPSDHLSYARSFPRTINLATADISKRMVSRHLLCRGDSYDGPVIAKSNLNSNGAKEQQLARAGYLPASFDRYIGEYPIFDSIEDVPDEVWQDRAMVVERFLPERIGRYFGLRTWMFLGNSETHSLSYATEPIVKAAKVVKREVLGEVPSGLKELREELGFDFGKFDYGLVDGEPVLYDANRTPSIGAFQPETVRPRLEVLASGLEDFL